MIVDGVRLRLASAQDAAVVAAVAQESFVATFGADTYPPADLAAFFADAMGPERYARAADDAQQWLELAEDHGTVAGYALAGPSKQDVPAEERAWELHQLYLASTLHGRGIADAMLTRVVGEARARGAAALYLSVWHGNHRAQRFYARHGFVEVGKLIYMVGSVEDDDRLWRLAL